MAQKSDWRWFGNAAHLIVGQDCRFHLATDVGNYLVSTVGEYLPDSNLREVLAESRGITLEGRGDARRADWMEKAGYEEIGLRRLYETMVFRKGAEECECGCGLPLPSEWTELDSAAANTAAEATANHSKLCEVWSSRPADYEDPS